MDVKSDQHETKGNEESAKLTDILLTLFNGLLVGVTFWLVFYTRRLWASTDKLVKDAEAATIREIRAYVGVVYPEVKIDGDRLIAMIEYQNSGQTPARDVQVRISANIYDGAPNWEEPGNPRDEWKGGVLMPSVTWQRYCPIKESLDDRNVLEKELLSEHGKKIWVWGIIAFTDIFHDRWETMFRFRSGHNRRRADERPPPWNQGRTGEFIPLIAELKHSKVIYKGRREAERQSGPQ